MPTLTEQKFLARDCPIEINVGTVGSPSWVTIYGLDNWTRSTSKSDAETTTNEDDGVATHLPAERSHSYKLSGKVLEDPDTGARDPGQQAVEELASRIGTAGLGQFRVTSPAGRTKTFMASAVISSEGGGKTDASAWSADLTGSGAITSSDDVDLPDAPTSPAGTGGSGTILATATAPAGTNLLYEAVVYNGSTVVTRVSSSALPIYIAGLAAGNRTVKLRALNLAGWGPLSTASSSITVS